jgi:hypothetical protein
MGKIIIILLIIGAAIGGVVYWKEVLHGELPSWGNLYDSTPAEKELADGVALMTNIWRRERVLPEFRTEESLCPYVHRYVREVAKTAGSRDSFQKMVDENTIVLQVSYDRIKETAGFATTAQDLVQLWAENSDDRETLQDETLTHRCVRCYQRYCAQIFIRQK